MIIEQKEPKISNMLFWEFLPKLKVGLLSSKIDEIFTNTRRVKTKQVSDFRKDQVDVIENIEIAKDGSIVSYLRGRKEPMRTYPERNTIAMACYFKRMFRLFLTSLERQNIIGKLISLISLKINYNFLIEYFSFLLQSQINQYLTKEENYAQPIRELRRVLRNNGINEVFIDVISLIFEDMAYRYRFQDDMTLINKENLVYKFNLFGKIKLLFEFKENKFCPAVREIYKVITEQGIRHDWRLMCVKDGKPIGDPKSRMIRKYACLLLEFCPPLLKKTINILKDMDINEVKPSKEDIYWMNQYNYNFFGKTIEERKQDNINIYGQ